MEKLTRRIQVLIEALPYIRQFYGKTMVIKYGGKAMEKEELKKTVAEDIVLIRYVGIKPVVIHGGGEAISNLMKRLKLKPHFIEGKRVTDLPTMEVVEMVLMGKINKEIVSLINRAGGKAVGLGGKDGGLIKAVRHPEEKLGFVGEIRRIDPSPLKVLEESGFVPVIAPIGEGGGGESLNINADEVAGEIAIALKAEKLVYLTDVRGIMENPADEKTLLSTVKVEEIESLIERGIIKEGMLPKIKAAKKALEGGVEKVHIISGRIKHSLLLEIFTDQGIGTQIIP